jgi:hypothetical protein
LSLRLSLLVALPGNYCYSWVDMISKQAFGPHAYPVEWITYNDNNEVGDAFYLYATVNWEGKEPDNLSFGVANEPMTPRPRMEPYVYPLNAHDDTLIVVKPPASVTARQLHLLQQALAPFELDMAWGALNSGEVVSVPTRSYGIESRFGQQLFSVSVSGGQLVLAGLRILVTPSIIRYSAKHS